VGETDHMVTETLIRGMYEYWRKVMEAPETSAGGAA
jgi:salicylate 5-hydroxylase large subunit